MGYEREIDPSAELAARIEHIEAKRFVQHSRAKNFLDKFEELLTTKTPRYYLVTGVSGSGKSELAEQFIRRHPIDMHGTSDAAVLPAIHATMPEKGSLSAFGEEILDAMMHESSSSTTAMEKMRMARKLTKSLNVKVVFLDEIQHLSLGGPINREQVRNGLKRYMKECGASVIALGIPEGLGIIHHEPQLRRHFKTLTLPAWQADEEGRSLLHKLETDFGLAKGAHIAHHETLSREVFDMAEGVLAHVVEMMQEAAIVAVKTGTERITREIIRSLGWVKHSEACRIAAAQAGISPTLVGIDHRKKRGMRIT